MNTAFFIFYCFLVTILPGPTNIIILSTVHNNGVKKAIEFCYGAILAFGIILIVSVFLNTFLQNFLPNVIFIMQIFGSMYILYLAYLIFNTNFSSINKKDIGNFKIGFFMQFINPKVLVFCLTVFPSFVMPYYNSIEELLIFVFIITIISGISFFSWLLLGKLLKNFLENNQKR